MAKFHDSIDALQSLVEASGLQGNWAEKPNNCWRFVAKNGGGLNWSATKGTLWFDGPAAAKAEIEAKFESMLQGEIPPPAKVEESGRIFVVHGHDVAAREQLELVLHKLGLQPFVLQNSDGGGLTIIESLEKMIGRNAESSFGIVLMTPDDVGYAKKEGDTEAKPRARQNVIMEMGMLLSSLTRARVAILQKGFVEHPSDTSGVIYLPFNDHVKEVVPKLAARLQAVGIVIDGSAIAHASA
jgi:predicted nucleotide-binding protein